jgi:Holliday junction DNA helicase RuvA
MRYHTDMIGSITGQVALIEEGSVIVEASGVGYRILVTPAAIQGAEAGTNLRLWTYMAVRENAIELFGFTNLAERKLFELLLSVSGIGPRSALAITALATPAVIAGAIARGNSAYLTTVSGIGRKTAEKIVIELRDKITPLGLETAETTMDTDAIEALRALGYSTQEAREALLLVGPSATTVSARVTEALRHLGRAN